MNYNYKQSLKLEVPKEIRLDVYKRAITIIENNEKSYGLENYCLCLLLPCILYELEHYLDNVNGLDENWHFWDTEIGFPELKGFMKNMRGVNSIDEKNKIRLTFLKEIVNNFVL